MRLVVAFARRAGVDPSACRFHDEVQALDCIAAGKSKNVAQGFRDHLAERGYHFKPQAVRASVSRTGKALGARISSTSLGIGEWSEVEIRGENGRKYYRIAYRGVVSYSPRSEWGFGDERVGSER